VRGGPTAAMQAAEGKPLVPIRCLPTRLASSAEGWRVWRDEYVFAADAGEARTIALVQDA
jgi:hypothetical protein